MTSEVLVSVVMLRGVVEEADDEVIVGRDAFVYLRILRGSKHTRRTMEETICRN